VNTSARGSSANYLRAATYYDMCLYFILGTTARAQEAAAYTAMDRCWQGASALSDPPFERVRIPYQGTWLPGWLLRPDSRPGRRPTVILNNGQDSQSVALYAYGGAAALDCGYNALIFEGPGQGAMLFERQVPFRPDWEDVITPSWTTCYRVPTWIPAASPSPGGAWAAKWLSARPRSSTGSPP
jgi:hypothetical protein